jgi:hypothetical protein
MTHKPINRLTPSTNYPILEQWNFIGTLIAVANLNSAEQYRDRLPSPPSNTLTKTAKTNMRTTADHNNKSKLGVTPFEPKIFQKWYQIIDTPLLHQHVTTALKVHLFSCSFWRRPESCRCSFSTQSVFTPRNPPRNSLLLSKPAPTLSLTFQNSTSWDGVAAHPSSIPDLSGGVIEIHVKSPVCSHRQFVDSPFAESSSRC